ncbi:uncharacterized protein [Musca autumnalis]|uniref:uncharacterized protein n=1 Tax=Musca autumnalis TaxID=221902 RepID=UPI003CF8605D
MWNFQRIICIWICCVSCMFGSTQLSSLVQAVPYEYFDDHDQSFYDLDTEQIQAKYDTRLLSQQMLKSSDTQEQQQQQQSLENKKGSSHLSEMNSFATNEEKMSEEHMGDVSFGKHSEVTVTNSDILTKLKTNDASQNGNSNHKDTTTRIDETTPAVTERQEIHLPRAASCYTNGQKYTHGQKVPRLDSCEVCLCMDGEIFCWWEKCDKKVQKSQTPRYDDYSTSYGESSTMRIQANEQSTIRTTLRPVKKPKFNKAYKYGQDNDDDEGEDVDDSNNLEEDGDEYDASRYRYGKTPYKGHHNNKQQMTKKKNHEEQQQHKEVLELKEKQMKIKKEKLKKQQQQQQQTQQQQHKTNNNNDHHYHHPEHHTSGAGSSKILNFPENLPSVLYYDYKTEEHQHHQHQHREQHLKHQHEKELKHRQHSTNGRHHEYGGGVGQDFNLDMSGTLPAVATTSQLAESSAFGRNNVRGGGGDLNQQQRQMPSSAKFLANGNDNIYNVDLQTDSDILPEPPTKKPKLSSIDTAPPVDSGAEGTPPHTTTLPYRLSTLSATSAGSTNITTRPLKKQMFTPWDYGKPNRDKVNKSINQRQQQQQKQQQQEQQNKDLVSAASDVDDDDDGDNDAADQDDAFHRWLTSTEKNKKTNGPQASGGAFDDDFEGDDKNYENIDIDIEAASMPLQATTTTAKTLTSPANAVGVGNQKYDINFNNNNGPNTFSSAGSIDNNSNSSNNNNKEENDNDNISPFSNPYQNYKDNNSPSSYFQRSGIKSQQDSSNNNNKNNYDGRLSSSEDQGIGGVVNIDIMLTATSDISPQQQQHQFQISEHDNNHNQPIQMDSKQSSHLISNTNGKDNEQLLSSSAAAATTNNSFVGNMPTSSPSSERQQQISGDGGNLLISNSSISSTTIHNSKNTTSQYQGNSFSDSSKLSQSPPLVSNSTAESSVAVGGSAQTLTPPTTSTTLSPERQCNVMGTLYKIGDVLPQDTGNCLQCICIDGSTIDDTPRVTCSPHNCPPLVLPDLFDATGY